jgi:imidazoleglycerol-phosphate dehydratase
MNVRTATYTRETRETSISATVRLDGPAVCRAETEVGFLNHMLEAMSLHGGMGIEVRAGGDTGVDLHHLIEDCGIVLGTAMARALEGSKSIARAGFFTFPMDGSLASAAVDLCGRPNLVWNVPRALMPIGDLDPNLFRDFFKGFSDSLKATVHVNVPYKDNDHHAVEAVFKAFGRALRLALEPSGSQGPLSTKGSIDD